MDSFKRKDLPNSATTWNDRAQAIHLRDRKIDDLDRYSSASNITLEQFLHLKVLWTFQGLTKFTDPQVRNEWLPERFYNEARLKLKTAPFWNKYIDSYQRFTDNEFGNSTSPDNDIGTFSLVRYYQGQVQRIKIKNDSEYSIKVSPRKTRITTRAQLSSHVESGPSRGPSKFSGSDAESSTPTTPTPVGRVSNLLEGMSIFDQGSESARSDALSDYSPIGPELSSSFPPTEDEQIVNAALLIFLSALIIHFPVPADWTLHRKAFLLGDNKMKGYEARVDGFLRSHRNDDVLAIVEVKPFLRSAKEMVIQMQEGAQMAAWICSQPPRASEWKARKGKPMM